MKSKKYIYGGKVSSVTNAAGVEGILIRSGSRYFFRVYGDDQSFTDYAINHDDLAVTISPDEDAYFYTDGERFALDHGPNAFALESVDENED